MCHPPSLLIKLSRFLYAISSFPPPPENARCGILEREEFVWKMLASGAWVPSQPGARDSKCLCCGYAPPVVCHQA